jgi:hypothetical protein
MDTSSGEQEPSRKGRPRHVTSGRQLIFPMQPDQLLLDNGSKDLPYPLSCE